MCETKQGAGMNAKTAVFLFTCAVLAAGCSGQFWGGAGTGALGAGAAYELTGQQQLKQLDEDLKNGKITQQEYDIRKNQIEKGHLIK
jgi:hypothetical protein